MTRAALSLFAARGVHAVSISEICAEASISRPTFYRCFDDKEALVDTLYAQAIEGPVQRNMLAVFRDGEDVGDAIDTLVDRMLAHPEMAAFALVMSTDPRTPVFAKMERMFDEAANAIVAAHRARGRDCLPPTALKAGMAACRWITQDALRRGGTPAARAEAKEAMRALVIRLFGPNTTPADR